MRQYFLANSEKAVYSVQEDCCYTKVVFEGPEVGVSGKVDQLEDGFNSWDILCYDCDPDPNKWFTPTTEGFYLTKLTLANAINALRSARPE
jgi:hypothetical protein